MKYIYLLKGGENNYKIGIAKNVSSRLNSIRTGNPEQVKVVACKPVENEMMIERSFHDYVRVHQAIGGTEWFKLTPEQAIDIAIKINEQPDIPGLDEKMELLHITKKHLEEYKAINRNLRILVNYISRKNKPDSKIERLNKITQASQKQKEIDEMFSQAVEIIKSEGRASTSLLQRKLKIGYGRASRLIDEMESKKLIGPPDGARPREILM